MSAGSYQIFRNPSAIPCSATIFDGEQRLSEIPMIFTSRRELPFGLSAVVVYRLRVVEKLRRCWIREGRSSARAEDTEHVGTLTAPLSGTLGP